MCVLSIPTIMGCRSVRSARAAASSLSSDWHPGCMAQIEPAVLLPVILRAICLYSSLHKYGFASSAEPLDAAGNANTALTLVNCRITNAVRCLPPQNKPEPGEINNCNGFVAEELSKLPKGSAIMALGTIAHQAVLTGVAAAQKRFMPVCSWRAARCCRTG